MAGPIRVRQRTNRTRGGRDKLGESREEMGEHAVILRRTPDHEDLVKATDSEVHCRLVGRWVGQGGKTSLVNTADTDILITSGQWISLGKRCGTGW